MPISWAASSACPSISSALSRSPAPSRATSIWITLLLTAFAALGIGLLISASVGNADRTQSLVPIVLIPQLIFVVGANNGGVGRWLSYLTVTHWSSEALKITAHIPYKAGASGFGTADLMSDWIALIVMAVVFVALTAWQLSRRQPA
jgi:hypothetical protein